MKIVDSSALIYCFNNKIKLEEVFHVIGDLDEEFELAELIHEEKRTNIEQASKITGFSEAYYLAQYSIMLNKHAGRSFTAMRGFGDIAILALVKSFIDNFGHPKQASLGLFGDSSDDITVITDDNGLTKRLRDEFGDIVAILTSKDLLTKESLQVQGSYSLPY